jgi:hypothetical protein
MAVELFVTSVTGRPERGVTTTLEEDPEGKRGWTDCAG